jgi:hypothetical protein
MFTKIFYQIQKETHFRKHGPKFPNFDKWTSDKNIDNKMMTIA